MISSIARLFLGLSWLHVKNEFWVVLFHLYIVIFVGCWIGFCFNFVRGKQVIVEANSRFGKSGQRMAQKNRLLNWWKKILEQRCNFCNPKHSAWCQYRSPWQSMTHNNHRMVNQWSQNPTLLPSIATAVVTCILTTTSRHQHIRVLDKTAGFDSLSRRQEKT